MNIHARFGVVDQNEYADTELCIKINPEVRWDFSGTGPKPDDRFFYDLFGTNVVSLANKLGPRSIQGETSESEDSDFQPDFYYEVKIVQRSGNFGIGCAPKYFDCSNDILFGCYENSCGYSANDGKIYNNKAGKNSKNGIYGKKDVVGCGMSNKHKLIYFTRNGFIEAIIQSYNKELIYQPTMSFVRYDEPTTIYMMKES